MNIPESAIQPFEPHGIPKLNTAMNIRMSMIERFITLNTITATIPGSVSLSHIREYVVGSLHECGASVVDIRITGYLSSWIDVHVQYKVTGDSQIHHMIRTVTSKHGFRNPVV
jgi:hypothetical protein